MERDHELEIARGIRRAYQRRLLLVLDIALFLIYCAVLGSNWNIPDVLRSWGMAWMIVVLLHTVWFIYAEALDFAVRRAVEKERFAYYRSIAETVLGTLPDEKPKRDPDLTLSDDGEFADEIEFDEREYRKRR